MSRFGLIKASAKGGVMSHYPNGIDLLCGKVVRVRYLPSGAAMVFTRFDEVVVDAGQEEAIRMISEGRRRMIVLRNGFVLGIFGRPRIRLLQMIQRGALITSEVIECSFPMYPKHAQHLLKQKWMR